MQKRCSFIRVDDNRGGAQNENETQHKFRTPSSSWEIHQCCEQTQYSNGH